MAREALGQSDVPRASVEVRAGGVAHRVEVEAALEAGALDAGMPASRVRVFESKTALVETMRKELDESAVLLVKGSRGMRMEEVVESLIQQAPAC